MKNKNMMQTIAFFALIILSTLLLVKFFLPIIGINISGVFVLVLETIQNVLVLVLIGVLAYRFSKDGKKWVKIVYWCALAVYVVAIVLMWI